MSRIAYVNGQYVAHRAASVHIEDRGYQFADGVYEVIAVHNGRLVDERPHLDRLARSLCELRIDAPTSEAAFRHILRRVIALNRLKSGTVYLQITRGVAPRDHAFPVGVRPQLVVTVKRAKPVPADLLEQGARVVSIPEQRWARRDIKSISLLPNILGKQIAREQGAYEAWQIEPDGTVTEGTSSNAWIVTADGEIVTRAAGPAILNGVTRLVVIDLARQAGMKVNERSFTLNEALTAREAFVTGTGCLVMPVTEIDGRVIANGRPGSFSVALREAVERHVRESA